MIFNVIHFNKGRSKSEVLYNSETQEFSYRLTDEAFQWRCLFSNAETETLNIEHEIFGREDLRIVIEWHPISLAIYVALY